MQVRDEFACIPIVQGGPHDGELDTSHVGMVWVSKEDARDQRVRLTQAGYRLRDLAVVHRLVTYTEWEVVPDSDVHP
jgi:hypothetical protein